MILFFRENGKIDQGVMKKRDRLKRRTIYATGCIYTDRV